MTKPYVLLREQLSKPAMVQLEKPERTLAKSYSKRVEGSQLA